MLRPVLELADDPRGRYRLQLVRGDYVKDPLALKDGGAEVLLNVPLLWVSNEYPYDAEGPRIEGYNLALSEATRATMLLSTEEKQQGWRYRVVEIGHRQKGWEG